MKWSKYNYILNCKHGVFVYNSTTNSFLKISLPLLDTFKNMKEGNIKIDELDEDIKKILITHNILVSNDFDDKYLTKLKYTHSRSAFANSQLSLTIATTTNCNFRCPYCYEAGISHTKMDVSSRRVFCGEIALALHLRFIGGAQVCGTADHARDLILQEIDHLSG